ncbi:YdbH domain-containing protein [Halopseudomonas sp.]|uniref:intermembrane phospholipid transport protein YdbH family protein n=1 Tax=Halopseudomonas sp. TaxID=2901191 RepID=UPI0035635CB5
MRWGVRLLAAIVALLLILMLAAFLLLRHSLSAAGIDQLAWQGLGWAGGALRVEQLSARHTDAVGARLEIDLRALQLEPGWAGGPHLAVLQAQELQLDWQPLVGLPGNRDIGMPDLQQLAATLQWLPAERLAIPRIQIHLPCGIRRCTLNGGLVVAREASGRFALQLELLAEQGSIALDGYLRSDAAGLEADLNLQLDANPAASLQTQWLYGDSAPRSQGVLTVPDWPRADWLLAYAQPWLGSANPAVKSLPTGLSAEVSWLLEPAGRPQTAAGLLAGSVEIRANLALADAWHIPDLGAVEGEAAIDLLGDDGLWQLRQGHARLHLSEPLLPALLDLPAEIRPQTVELDVKSQADSQLAWSRRLPLIVEARATGSVEATLAGPVAVVSQPQWQAQWDKLQLQVAAERLDLASLQLHQLGLDWQLSGSVDEQQLDLRLGQGASISLASIQAPDQMALSGVRADLSGLALQIPLAEPTAIGAAGPLTISASRVEHPLFKPQAWTVKGTLTREPNSLSWQGSVAAASDLALEVAFAWPAEEAWRMDVELEPAFLRAGDPLSTTLAGWPELLALSRGRLLGQISLRGAAGLERASGWLELDGAAGIYDRMAFQGLSTRMDIDLAGDRLQLDMPALTLETLDPGVAMGPLSVDLRYAAHLERLLAGLLRIEHAQVQVLGGQVLVEPAVLNLSSASHALVLDIRGVELDRLFAAYPAEGLEGRGTLDGRLPVTLVDGELVIEEGELDARAPGGFLKYRSEKLKNLAESAPGMRQVAQALDDFHYDLLAADVTYREGGILVLGLELQGRNPAVQDGRPIHLNIRLEEDIPALLASLQLSGKVSEVIQERVRQRLLQQRADP